MEAGDRSPGEAKFFWAGGPVQVAPDTWFASTGSGVTAFATCEGLVLVDSGTRLFGPDMAERIRDRTDLPVHTAVYTHGHVDHAFGLGAFLSEDQPVPRIIGQAGNPRHDRTLRPRSPVSRAGRAPWSTGPPPRLARPAPGLPPGRLRAGGRPRRPARHRRGRPPLHRPRRRRAGADGHEHPSLRGFVRSRPPTVRLRNQAVRPEMR
ncbi:MBL fold metallo-hydrolase [Actinomadura nitritigenes]|uniref:MBL fold metallo-hydrolase n=1 Tax=Actinomadura nitritigenes TaxID=134602 RepID=UPI003D8B50C9